MTQKRTYGSPGRDWMRQAAAAEDQHEAVTVGGLACDLGMLSHEGEEQPRVLSRLVEWRRLELGMTEEQLAAAAGIDLGELRAIEQDAPNACSTRVIFKIARSLTLSPEKLAMLAGLAETREDKTLSEATVRFAAKSSTAKLSREQRHALDEYVKVLTQSPPKGP